LNQEAALTPANAAPITSFTEADFDLDVSQQHTTALKKENLAQEKLEIPALADIDLSFGDAKMQANDQTEEIKYDFPVVDEDVATISASGSALEPVASNNFDFSSISLDLSDASANTSATATIETTEVLSSPEDLAVSDAALVQAATITSVEAIENPDVDIKLDLVKVYIDMEDVEGARELLDEVVKEGGPQQRKKAEQLLASLA
jgi:pilus assembly protein FimV